jgi:DNA-binding NarL/FixJ family response regulator
MILSRICLFRECVSQALDADPSFQVVEACASLDTALASAMALRPGMILLDAAFDEGPTAVARLRLADPQAEIVAVTLEETEENIVAWAEAGIAGYIPDTASMRELPTLLLRISSGEQSCPSRISGSLLRSLGRFDRRDGHGRGPAGMELTLRERTILRLLSAGLTNKDIARQLDISLGTAKSHVHNILSKLNLRSRAQLAARMGRGLIETLRP